MPGGSDHCEAVLPLSLHDLIGPQEGSSDGQSRGLLGVLAEIGVEDCEVASVGFLGPEFADVLDVLLGVDQSDFLVGGFALEGGDEVNLGVFEVPGLLQHLHDPFHSLGFLWVGLGGTVLKHTRVAYDPGLAFLHPPI